MNYNYPFYGFAPSAGSAAKGAGLFSGLLKNGVNWGSLLTNTQRTLGIINQAIPVVKEISPMINNAKTMFGVLNEFKKSESPLSTNTTVNDTVNDSSSFRNDYNNNLNNNQATNITNNNQNFTPNNQEGPIFFA